MSKRQYIFILAFAFIGGGVGGALSGMLLVERLAPKGQELKKVLVANEYHLVDDEGRERWVLALSKEGEPNITFVNTRGWAPMSIGINRDGFPFFNMILEPFGNGGPSLLIMDSNLRNRVLLGLRENGEPSLTLSDHNGQMRAILGGMELKNPLTGTIEERSISSLVLLGEDGRIIWSSPQAAALPLQASKGLKNAKQ
jgi:hypothetical protein